MQLRDKKILLTGATGGIGNALAKTLHFLGAKLILAGRSPDAFKALAAEICVKPASIAVVHLDLASSDVNEQALAISREHPDLDMIVNCAGMNLFSASASAPADEVSRLLDVNLKGTILLTQALLPTLMKRPQAAIVNVGSTFGSIGYPGFAAYCASKFGLRGYSEALRRELANSSVRVFYVAPRATATAMNDAAVQAMNAALGNAVDDPAAVAEQIVLAIVHDRSRLFIGWPEKLFVYMNGMMSSVVDRALIKQLPIIQRFLLKEAKS
jgi:short-subunit dehydrogenase